jgi:hypothetical protein
MERLFCIADRTAGASALIAAKTTWVATVGVLMLSMQSLYSAGHSLRAETDVFVVNLTAEASPAIPENDSWTFVTFRVSAFRSMSNSCIVGNEKRCRLA